MEIISNRITKWQQSNNRYKGTLQHGERQSFQLIPEDPIFHQPMLIIKGDLYITNVDTDFILDIGTETVVYVASSINGLTSEFLYSAYTFVYSAWSALVLEESVKKGIYIDLSEVPPSPFSRLRKTLEHFIK